MTYRLDEADFGGREADVGCELVCSVGVSFSTTASIPGLCLVAPLETELGREGMASIDGEGVVMLRERLFGRRAAGLLSVGVLLAAVAMAGPLLSEV